MMIRKTECFLHPALSMVNQVRVNTAWGPNTLYIKGKFFVGTKPPALKYYWPFPKKPNQPYGIQGYNHLIPQTGLVAKNLPCKVRLEKDLVYAWCTCGRSFNQPFCDGTHNRSRNAGVLHPVRYIPEKTEEVWLCQCKQTKNRPFCDGSHKNLTAKQIQTAREIVTFE